MVEFRFYSRGTVWFHAASWHRQVRKHTAAVFLGDLYGEAAAKKVLAEEGGGFKRLQILHDFATFCHQQVMVEFRFYSRGTVWFHAASWHRQVRKHTAAVFLGDLYGQAAAKKVLAEEGGGFKRLQILHDLATFCHQQVMVEFRFYSRGTVWFHAASWHRQVRKHTAAVFLGDLYGQAAAKKVLAEEGGGFKRLQ